MSSSEKYNLFQLFEARHFSAVTIRLANQIAGNFSAATLSAYWGSGLMVRSLELEHRYFIGWYWCLETRNINFESSNLEPCARAKKRSNVVVVLPGR